MTTVIRRPSLALAPFVEAFWYVEERLPAGRERTMWSQPRPGVGLGSA